MSGCWKDWNGLEEVTEVTALWGEGIGTNSHTLKLQELGGFAQVKTPWAFKCYLKWPRMQLAFPKCFSIPSVSSGFYFCPSQLDDPNLEPFTTFRWQEAFVIRTDIAFAAMGAWEARSEAAWAAACQALVGGGGLGGFGCLGGTIGSGW